MTVEIRLATTEELPRCLAVRRTVFIEGQGVPEELEVDGLDDECTHFLAHDEDCAVGTARLRITNDGQAKAERVAVLPDLRGRKIGAQLMDVLEKEARRRGHAEVVLNAQVTVIGFYEARGYVAIGPRFDEAGIEHQKMSLPL